MILVRKSFTVGFLVFGTNTVFDVYQDSGMSSSFVIILLIVSAKTLIHCMSFPIIFNKSVFFHLISFPLSS